jgi:hypothetical protein
MRYFKMADALRVSGATEPELRTLSEKGLTGRRRVHPGAGRYRLYSEAEIVAVAVGVRWRREGAHHSLVEAIVRFLVDLDPEALARHFKRGEIFLAAPTIVGGTVVESGRLMRTPPDPDDEAQRLN